MAALGTFSSPFWQSSAAHAQRVLGLDTSSAANSTAPTQAAWNNAFNDTDGDGQAYKFAFVRSNHGLSNDDTQFYTNISRATTAGLLTGSYNYVEPTVNTATVEANYYLSRAAAYMKPGYLLPVLDLESGNSLSQSALTQWASDYMNTIFAAQGIYPIVYTNSSYNNDEVSASIAFSNTSTTPKTGPITYQWLARPSGNLATGQPGAATNYPNPYGVWDPNFVTKTNSRDPATNPWAFWQNGSGSPNGFLIDKDAANGNIEYVKDFLVPALWTNSGSGDWSTISNWNSDNPSYVAGNTATGPAPRLPNNSSLDWVKLQNTGNGTVTISSGAQTVRKFYTQQPLNITGGSLSVSYLPGSGGLFDLPSEFKAAVTLSAGAAYSAHTTQIDGAGGQFNLNGGTITFTNLQLASHATSPGKIVMNGNTTFAQTGSTASSVIRSTGSLAQSGTISLSAGNQTFTVNNGSSSLDLDVRVSITGTGRLIKAGPGTMRLAAFDTYSGGTTLSAGILSITADNRLGSVPGSNSPQNILLDGGTLRTGAQIDSATLTSAGSNYTSFPTLTLSGGGADLVPASANVLAGLRTIAVTTGGSNYINQTTAPAANSAGTFVDIVGGGGTGAAAFATVASGVVTSITVTNPGTGYTSLPTISISSTVNTTGTAIGLAGASAVANVSGISLQSISLNDGGFDYNTPAISLTGGGGSGATATASASPNWSLATNRGIQLTSSGGTLYQTAGSSLTYAGSITSSSPGPFTKSGAGSLTLSGANSYTGPTTVSAGTLILTQSLQTSPSLTIANAAKTILTPHTTSPTKLLQFSTLNLNTTGTLDLNDNKLTLQYTGLSPAALVRGYLLSAYNSATWTGTGLTSTTAANDSQHLLALGYLDTGSTLTVQLTTVGDANLDGKVNADDFALLDRGFAQHLSTWQNGDFNYDGIINAQDYALLDRSFALAGNPLTPSFLSTRESQFGSAYITSLITSIPEPNLPTLLAILITTSRRRRTP
ncbi:MAG TPA: autotransporter-associated beta strand repeat-containing protein [Tepidisphaeraceae bacterium]|nr:autotransporter-associated beta strand repeat-containing protein [Tepidisphaeraceae bacterium]